jgi:hypothetical protein
MTQPTSQDRMARMIAGYRVSQLVCAATRQVSWERLTERSLSAYNGTAAPHLPSCRTTP